MSPRHEGLGPIPPFPCESFILCLLGCKDGEEEGSVVVPVRGER